MALRLSISGTLPRTPRPRNDKAGIELAQRSFNKNRPFQDNIPAVWPIYRCFA
jgi:hypothetical protein